MATRECASTGSSQQLLFTILSTLAALLCDSAALAQQDLPLGEETKREVAECRPPFGQGQHGGVSYPIPRNFQECKFKLKDGRVVRCGDTRSTTWQWGITADAIYENDFLKEKRPGPYDYNECTHYVTAKIGTLEHRFIGWFKEYVKSEQGSWVEAVTHTAILYKCTTRGPIGWEIVPYPESRYPYCKCRDRRNPDSRECSTDDPTVRRNPPGSAGSGNNNEKPGNGGDDSGKGVGNDGSGTDNKSFKGSKGDRKNRPGKRGWQATKCPKPLRQKASNAVCKSQTRNSVKKDGEDYTCSSTKKITAAFNLRGERLRGKSFTKTESTCSADHSGRRPVDPGDGLPQDPAPGASTPPAGPGGAPQLPVNKGPGVGDGCSGQSVRIYMAYGRTIAYAESCSIDPPGSNPATPTPVPTPAATPVACQTDNDCGAAPAISFGSYSCNNGFCECTMSSDLGCEGQAAGTSCSPAGNDGGGVCEPNEEQQQSGVMCRNMRCVSRGAGGPTPPPSGSCTCSCNAGAAIPIFAENVPEQVCLLHIQGHGCSGPGFDQNGHPREVAGEIVDCAWRQN